MKNTKLQAKKLGHLDEKTAKNAYLYVPFCQKYFSKSKSHSLNAAHDQETSLAQKKSSRGNFTYFRFQVKTASERILLPVKKPILLFES